MYKQIAISKDSFPIPKTIEDFYRNLSQRLPRSYPIVEILKNDAFFQDLVNLQSIDCPGNGLGFPSPISTAILSINDQDLYGNTLLHYLARVILYGHVLELQSKASHSDSSDIKDCFKVFARLLCLGGDTTVQNNENETPEALFANVSDDAFYRQLKEHLSLDHLAWKAFPWLYTISNDQ